MTVRNGPESASAWLAVFVEACLHGLDDVLVFPAGDAPLLAFRALIEVIRSGR
jgi:hypothetical protein